MTIDSRTMIVAGISISVTLLILTIAKIGGHPSPNGARVAIGLVAIAMIVVGRWFRVRG